MTQLSLTNLRFHAFHGVIEQERKTGGEYIVDVSMNTDAYTAAMQSDNIADTVNYAVVYDLICREMQLPSNLIENVAYRIGRAIKNRFPKLGAVCVRITKVNPPISAAGINASFELTV